MAKQVKFAIINNEEMDFLRLIIMKEEDGKYSIKISTHDNPFEIYLYHLFNPEPRIIIPHHNNNEITYHADKNDNPVKIHIKDIGDINNPIYRTLPIREISAPSSNDIFMIPLMKICLPNKSNKVYVSNTRNKEINIGNSNTIELYMHSSNLDYKDIGFFDILYSFFSIEYFTIYNLECSKDKQTILFREMKENGSISPIRSIKTDIDITIRYNFYRDDNYKSDKIRISFMENKYSNDLIMNTIFKYDLENNKCINGMWDNVYIRPCKEKDIPLVTEINKPFVKDSVIEHLTRRASTDKKEYYYKLGIKSVSTIRKLFGT